MNLLVKTKSNTAKRLHGDVAGIWGEGYYYYPGRSGISICQISFGFRPNRKAHDAIIKAKQYIEEGYQWVVDLDIEKFFDHINHLCLLPTLRKKQKLLLL